VVVVGQFRERDVSMSERAADKMRIDNARGELLRQRLVVLASLKKLEAGIDLLRQLVNEAPFDGMASFESDVLICKDHLRETTREIWAQIDEMIHSINGKSVRPANRHVLPASSFTPNLVKVMSHVGTGDVWAEATEERVTFFNVGGDSIRLAVPVKSDSEKERVIHALLDLAQFYEDQLSDSQKR